MTSPTPWTISSDCPDGLIIEDKDSVRIAWVLDEDDARLFAEAPELQRWLEAAMREACSGCIGTERAKCEYCSSWKALARGALRKAKGET